MAQVQSDRAISRYDHQQLQHPSISPPSYQQVTRNQRPNSASTSHSAPPFRNNVTCSNAFTPHLSMMIKRLLTFRDWHNPPELPTPKSLSEAGFFFLGRRDRVKCFNCNGGLQGWEPGEDPWTEHAKWFPECEFLQLSKGVEFVKRVVELNPDIQRPRIHNPIPLPSDNSGGMVVADEVPSQYETPSIDGLVNQAMAKEVVQMALLMTSDESIIRNLVRKKLEEEEAEYDSVSGLVEDFQKAEENERSSTPEDDQMEWGDASSGPSTDVSPTSSTVSSDSFPVSSSGESASAENNPYAAVPAGFLLMNNFEPSPLPEYKTSSNTIDHLTEEDDDDDEECTDEETCKVCLTKRASCIFNPCHHLCCCVSCASALKTCPVCRAKISSIFKIYRK